MYEFIYLIKEENTNNYKIGFTKNINKRIKTLQTANPNNLILINKYKLLDKGKKLESMLHNRFKLKRINNEWFELNKEDVKNFIKECKYQHKIIKMMIDNPFF